jgi:hypothetical protein
MPKIVHRQAALGFRVKSGYATVVLLDGSTSSMRVVDRRKIDLCDPSVPDSRQPYHAGFGSARGDLEQIARLVEVVERHADRSVADAVRDYRHMGYELDRAGAVVGSETNPEAIANPHVRAHASEGRLFRRITEDALGRLGLACSIWVERTLYASAAQRLGYPEDRIRQLAAGLGDAVAGGWRADDKTAAVAAWLALAIRDS